MPILSRKLTQFDKEDVELLDKMLAKFATYKKGSGVPDHSPNYVAYFPVLAIAFLKSQQRLEKLTWVLIGLTVVLAIVTGLNIALALG
jgi:hypothetical protein